jgi:hypothetical protein
VTRRLGKEDLPNPKAMISACSKEVKSSLNLPSTTTILMMVTDPKDNVASHIISPIETDWMCPPVQEGNKI